MPFTVVAVLLAVAYGYARGGRLRRIADAPLVRPWLLYVGLGLQVAVDVGAARTGSTGWRTTVVLLASQVLVLAWVWANRFLPGMPLVVLGLLANAAVIAANGAMPVDPEAIAAAGLPPDRLPPGKHVTMTDASRLRLLADIIPIAPLRTIVSVGDLLLGAGLLPLVAHLMTYRTPEERRGGARQSTPADVATGPRDARAPGSAPG